MLVILWLCPSALYAVPTGRNKLIAGTFPLLDPHYLLLLFFFQGQKYPSPQVLFVFHLPPSINLLNFVSSSIEAMIIIPNFEAMIVIFSLINSKTDETVPQKKAQEQLVILDKTITIVTITITSRVVMFLGRCTSGYTMGYGFRGLWL